MGYLMRRGEGALLNVARDALVGFVARVVLGRGLVMGWELVVGLDLGWGRVVMLDVLDGSVLRLLDVLDLVGLL